MTGDTHAEASSAGHPMAEVADEFARAWNDGNREVLESIRARLDASGVGGAAPTLDHARRAFGDFRLLDLAEKIGSGAISVENAVHSLLNAGWPDVFVEDLYGLFYTAAGSSRFSATPACAALFRLGEQLARSMGDDTLLFHVSFVFGLALSPQPAQALPRLESALMLAESVGRGKDVGRIRLAMFDAQLALGDVAAARRVLDEARAAGQIGEAACLKCECDVHLVNDDLDLALQKAERLAARDETDEEYAHIQYARERAATILISTGRPLQALNHLSAAIRSASRRGDSGRLPRLSDLLLNVWSVQSPVRAKGHAAGEIDREVAAQLRALVVNTLQSGAHDFDDVVLPGFAAEAIPSIVAWLLPNPPQPWHTSGVEERLTRLQLAREIAKRADLAETLPRIQVLLAECHFDAGDLPRAAAAYGQAIEQWRNTLGASADAHGVLPKNAQLTEIVRCQFNYHYVIALLHEHAAGAAGINDDLVMARGHPDAELVVVSLLTLADLMRLHGAYAASIKRYDEACAIAREAGLTEHEAAAELFLGMSLYITDRYEDAIRHFRRTIEISSKEERIGEIARGQLWEVMYRAAGAADSRGDFENALRLFREVEENLSQAPEPHATRLWIGCIVHVARMLQVKGEHAAALAHLDGAIGVARTQRQNIPLLVFLERKMQLLLSQSERDAALAAGQEAKEIATTLGKTQDAARIDAAMRVLPERSRLPATLPQSTDEIRAAVRSGIDVATTIAAELQSGTIDLDVAEQQLEIILAMPAEEVPPLQRGIAAVHFAKIPADQERLAIAGERFAAAREVIRDLPGPAGALLRAECDGGEGAILHHRGERRRAAELFESAAAIRRDLDPRRFAAAAGNLGEIYMDLGEYRKAQRWYEEALPIRMRLGNRRGSLIALENLATIAHRLDDFSTALAMIDRAVDMAYSASERISALTAKFGLLEEMGRWGEARGLAAELEALARAENDLPTAIDAALRRGLSEKNEGARETALATLSAALEEALQNDLDDEAAEIAQTIAELQFAADRQAAILVLRRVLDWMAASGNRSTSALLPIAQGFAAIDEMPSALEVANRAYALATERALPGVAISARRAAGKIRWFRGDLQGAFADYHAVAAAEEQRLGKPRAATLEGLGMVARDMGNLSESLQYFMRSVSEGEDRAHRMALYSVQIAAFSRGAEAIDATNRAIGTALLSGDESDVGFANAMAAGVLLSCGYSSLAAARAETACRILLDEQNDESHGAQALLARANALSVYRGVASAAASFERCIEISERKNLLPVLAAALNNYGRARAEAGELDAAIPLLEHAIEVCRRIGMNELLSTALVRSGRVYYEKADLDRAYESASEGYRLNESLRAGLNATWERFGRRAEAKLATETLAFIAAARGDAVEAWRLSEQLHARILAEDLSGGSIDVAECSARLGKLDAGAALVSYVVSPREVLITVCTATGDVTAVRVPITGRFHRLVENVDLEVAQYPRYGTIETWQELSASLLAPIWQRIEHASSLVIVPDETLWHVPVHALKVQGKPLIAWAEVTYAPNATSWISEEASFRARAVVVGNPTEDLDYAGTEAEHVAETLHATPLLGNAATRATVFAALADNNLLHYSGHAVRGSEGAEAGLRLADDLVRAADLSHACANTTLAVLSGCETGRLQTAGGGEVLGLTSTLLAAGVRTIVATQWPVNDKQTSEIMRDFYRQLMHGAPVASALRAAMLPHVESAPAHLWAPFIVVGNPRLLIERASQS